MAEVKFEKTKERMWEWAERWSDHEWNSPEWRQFVISLIRDGEEAQAKLNEIEPLYEEQVRYINLLERQMELLQKTLDLAEKLAPRLTILQGNSEVIK